MNVLSGKGICGGIAIGKLKFYQKASETIKRYKAEASDIELKRLELAKEKAAVQLRELYEKALVEVGEEGAMIFDAHQMMLEDVDYLDSIKNIITSQSVNAEYAVGVTCDHFVRIFSSMEDEYMKERAADIKDISERLVRALHGGNSGLILSGPVILAAEDLAPSETVQMDKSKILAFVTRQGSVNSHTAILARTMNIPAIIGVGEELLEEYDGLLTVVDGFTGRIYIEPEEATIQELQEKKRKEEERRTLLLELKGKDNITKSGRRMDVFANIGSGEDIGEVLKNDAGGIGLMRSEFLYLNKDTFPTEEEQFTIYKQVAESMAGKKVIIRTLDIGADKQAAYFNLPKEENPAMGYRAIRICLTRQEIFKTQLRALYRASAFGNIAIMFPMIISVEEVLEIKEILAEVRRELDHLGVEYNHELELGIMIETPAAVMIGDLLAKEVDFFSIGTNDLTQYTTAVDRQNPRLEKFYHPHHPAILRMLRMTVEYAHQNGIRVGICGELAADITMTETFLQMGIDELSVSPGMVLEVRKTIRGL